MRQTALLSSVNHKKGKKIPGKQPLFPGYINPSINYAILLTAFVRREIFLEEVFLFFDTSFNFRLDHLIS